MTVMKQMFQTTIECMIKSMTQDGMREKSLRGRLGNTGENGGDDGARTRDLRRDRPAL
jgi:hypothetical protein